MTITFDEVHECFGTTVNRDFLRMIAGDILGAGAFRIVFQHEHRKDLVLKFEPRAHSFHNIAEWDFWHDNKNRKSVARWLAPCAFISPCGAILAMKKTSKPQLKDYPKKLPRFLTDLKRKNFGLYKGKLVAHDYGLYRVNVPTDRARADWWGDSTT